MKTARWRSAEITRSSSICQGWRERGPWAKPLASVDGLIIWKVHIWTMGEYTLYIFHWFYFIAYRYILIKACLTFLYWVYFICCLQRRDDINCCLRKLTALPPDPWGTHPTCIWEDNSYYPGWTSPGGDELCRANMMSQSYLAHFVLVYVQSINQDEQWGNNCKYI